MRGLRTILTTVIIAVLSVSGYSQKLRTAEAVIDHLELDGLSDSMKVERIFNWVISNIAYDPIALRQIQAGRMSRFQFSEEVLKNQKAVCEGYANLFHDLCEKSSLKSTVILGYARGGTYSFLGRNTIENHAWNAVMIEGEWRLVDCTWSAGYLDQNQKFHFKKDLTFFHAQPEELCKTHYPFDPAWQLSLAPITVEQYKKRVFDNDEKGFQFNDTIRDMLKLDNEERLITVSERILRFDPENPLAASDLCSLHLDKAKAIIDTQYERLRKAQKEKATLKNEGMYSSELDRTEAHINSGEAYLKMMRSHADPNIKSYTSDAKNVVDEYRTYVREQRKWFARYFKNPGPLG